MEKITLLTLFSRTFKLVKTNLILVQPLLLFLFVIIMLVSPVISSNAFIPNYLAFIFLISIFGLTCAFIAGWFNMFHKCITNDNPSLAQEEAAVESLKIFKEFFPGVGKNFNNIFLGIILGVILYFIFFILVSFLGSLIAEKFLDIPPELSQIDTTNIPKSRNDLATFVAKIPSNWIIFSYSLFFAYSFLFLYLTMFWAQAVVAKEKNPFQAYIESIKIIIKKPLNSLIIFVSYNLSIFLISLLLELIKVYNVAREGFANFVIQLLSLSFAVLFLVYFTMMKFLFFEKVR